MNAFFYFSTPYLKHTIVHKSPIELGLKASENPDILTFRLYFDGGTEHIIIRVEIIGGTQHTMLSGV